MKAWHIGLCIGFMALGLVLVVTGAGAFAFLAPLGCVAMMAMMFWMMAPSRFKTKRCLYSPLRIEWVTLCT